MASTAGRNTLTVVRAALKRISNTKGYERLMGKVVIMAAEPGQLKAQFTVAEEHLNTGGTLHGGHTAYLVDVLSSLALMTVPPNLPGVSVDLSVAYMKAAKAGDTVTVDAVTLKVGRQLGFSSVDLRNDAGQLLAQGKHTKFLI